MIGEFLKALFLAGIPVGLFSYVLIWWGIKREYFANITELKVLEDEVKQMAKARSSGKKKAAVQDDAKPKFSAVHNKWLKFGGGFYGVVALMTFGIIEGGEILGFFANFRDNLRVLGDFNIGLLIEVFIDQLMNFISALAWPWYWAEYLRHDVLWFLAAYAGYWLGARAAIAYRPAAESEV